MGVYREEIDKSVLNGLKNKILRYLESRGFKNLDLVKSNLDNVVGLYVENLKEQGGPLMVSRAKPPEIAIDIRFVELNKDKKPIRFETRMKKLIGTQLTHELLHSGARYNNGPTGILDDTRRNTGLNEGLTQMFTEKIWGYTLSPNSDRRYKDFKKIAKILDTTFGEQVSIDAYFYHSNVLENSCNGLSQNSNFYNELNYFLTSIFAINKVIPKESRESYYDTITQPLDKKMTDLVYDKVCAEIIIPKLRTLSKDEQKSYLKNLLDSVKDDTKVLTRISETIIRYSNMTEKELQEQVKSINKELRQTEMKKQFVRDTYKSDNCSELVEISDDGKTIRAKGKNPFTIEDENLKEKILAQIYLKNNRESKSSFEERVSRFFEKDKPTFKASKASILDRKKAFSAMKVTAREQGYFVCNSLEECERGEDIPIQVIKVQEGEKIEFQDLKAAYQRYEIFYKDNDYTKEYVRDRKTGIEITDPQIKTIGIFASVWGAAAGTKWYPDEEVPGITYAFDDEGPKEVFDRLGELIETSMIENGTIDTKTILERITEVNYKYSKDIARKLLENPAGIKAIYEFYKMQNKDARMETELAETSTEITYNDDKKEEDRLTMANMIAEEKFDIIMETLEKSGKISIEEVKNSVTRKRITLQETQKAMQDMKRLMEIKKLQDMQRSGQILTPEQKLLLDEHIQQIQQAQKQFQQRQARINSNETGKEI